MRIFLVSLALLSSAYAASPVKVFILAGQSNMEGQAVVDLAGKDYNDGKGTLVEVMKTNPEFYRHLKNPDGSWRVRDDVFVRYQRENRPLLAGPLGIGFAVYGGTHHFGPELQFGHVLGDRLENPVLLIKTAWGGKSLYRDFRPPSSGDETGPYYKLMIAQVKEALAAMGTDFPALKGRDAELAGFVWYHGWNDGVDPQNAVPEYEANLVNLIKDVRRDLAAPNLPAVIGELTGPWVDAPEEWTKLREAQAAAAARPEFAGNAIFVPTRKFVRSPEESPNPTHGHHEFGNAHTYFLVGLALGKGMLSLLGPPDVLKEMRALQKERKWKELIDRFGDEALESSEAMRIRGQSYLITRNGARAELDLRAALLQDVADTATLLLLAENYANNLHDDTQALKAYREVLTITGHGQGWQPLTATLEIARILTSQVKPDEALEALKPYGDLTGMAPIWRIKMLRAYGHIYAAQGREQESLAKFREALSLESTP